MIGGASAETGNGTNSDPGTETGRESLDTATVPHLLLGPDLPRMIEMRLLQPIPTIHIQARGADTLTMRRTVDGGAEADHLPGLRPDKIKKRQHRHRHRQQHRLLMHQKRAKK